ncbi:ROK family transcriptional regulator [Nonomuraea sp. NPDC050680]|uniref:ROK family transcriptional regulator n=1 Tax=Nonomuraea sp. NPDC050680 TaxID=3154630 RepID=UPI0033E5D6E6
MWDVLPDAARSIVKELIIHGPQSRTALARTLRLSTGSLTRLTKPMVDAGLLIEGDVVHDPVNGRPTRPLDVAAGEHCFFGVKLTADRVHAVVTDLRAQIVAARDEPISDHRPQAVCRQIRGLLDELSGGERTPVGAGVTLGGDARSAAQLGGERLVDSSYLGWRQVPLKSLLEQALGIPCVVKNDVAALGHQHHWFGAARGLRDFALVSIGAGVGYALVVHDHLVAAAESDLGMFAHLVLNAGGPMCGDGHRGCASAYLASESIVTAAGQGLRRPVTYEEVMRLATEGDKVCLGVVTEAADALGRLIAHVATFSMVKTVIVAGEGVELARVAKDGLDRALSANRRGRTNSVDVLIEVDDFREWARGGAVVAIQNFVTGSD